MFVNIQIIRIIVNIPESFYNHRWNESYGFCNCNLEARIEIRLKIYQLETSINNNYKISLKYKKERNTRAKILINKNHYKMSIMLR